MMNRRFNTSFRYFFKRVKNFLSKAQSKELLTFFFFLVLSFLFWILQSMNEDSESSFRIPVNYTNIPTEFIINNEPPQFMNVRIKDKGIVLLNYSLGKSFRPIDIDVKNNINNSGKSNLFLQQLQPLIRRELKPSSSIISLTPDTITLSYSRLKEKSLPVLLNAKITLGQQSKIGNKIIIRPDSVIVLAPENVLDTLKYAYTSFLDIINITDTISKEVSLLHLPNVKYKPSNVNITIPVEEYTEKKISLPIEVINAPDSVTIRTFPSDIQLSCFVMLSVYKDINLDTFKAYINYDDIKEGNKNKAAVHLEDIESNVYNIRIVPDSVEFLIEEKYNGH